MSSSGFGDWDVSPLQSQEPAPPPPSVPERLGEYRIRGLIGRGGMGMVLRGYHPVLEAEVAIKLLRPLPLGPDPRRVERFRREAMASARLRHPNIVGVHTVGVHEQLPYLVMDLVDGVSLEEQLKQSGPLPVRRAAEVALGLAEALEHAHDRHVIHRDVKPSNVFLTTRGQPLLGDFGLAKVQDMSHQGLTGTRDVLGTPGYMAPEQARGGQADARSDVYALGATLYAMLVGHPPHQAGTLLAFLDQLTRHPAPPVREVRPDVPRDLAWITMRCLERDPGARYPSATALAGDLRRFLAGQRVRPGKPWAARVVLAVVACMLVAAGALVTRALRQGGGSGAPAGTDLGGARAALEQGQPDVARRLADEALAADPQDLDALALRAEALERLGQLTLAETDLTTALAGRAADGELWLRRARLRQRQGELEAALGDYGEALERGVACWKERGLLLKELNRFLAATEDLARAAALAPGDAALWRELAWTRGSARELEGAREALERAKALEPEHVDNWLIEAQLVAPKSVVEAIRCYDRAIAMEPRKAQLYIDRAQYRTLLRDWEGIIDDTTRVVELDPQRSDGWNNRASAYFELKKFRQAIEDYNRAIELVPEEPLLYTHRAMAWMELREMGRGFEDIERALALDPEFPQALHVQGHLLASEGRLDEALAVARRASNSPVVRLDAQLLIGQVLVVQKRWREAVEALDQVLRARPQDLTALYTRAMCLANAGRLADAAGDIQRFLQLADPRDPRVAEAQRAQRDLQDQLGN